MGDKNMKTNGFFFDRATNQEDLDLCTLKTKLMLLALAMQ